MTPSEIYVAELCNKSFLPFWSFANPLGKKNKELCDVLIVCENIIVIVSIKDIKVSESPDEVNKYNRWFKNAIANSADQLYGAERYLEKADEIVLKDGKTKIKLPLRNERKIYRIAIAFGSLPKYPLEYGDFGKGFVHVFDEASTFTIINELDTITDFVNYLDAKEKFVLENYVIASSELDFLAFYLDTALIFDRNKMSVSIDGGLWDEYAKSEAYNNWQTDIKESFIWDELIRQMYSHHVETRKDDVAREEIEVTVRKINLETRINRMELGCILSHAIKKKPAARMLRPLPGSEHTYVIMPLTEKNWVGKESELQLDALSRELKTLKQKK